MKLIALPPTVSTRAAEEIRAAISNGTLAPGSRMRQEELAAKLGVSREPIRKALLLLEREGLVNVVKRGAIVAPVDPHFLCAAEGQPVLHRVAAARFAAGLVTGAIAGQPGGVRGAPVAVDLG